MKNYIASISISLVLAFGSLLSQSDTACLVRLPDNINSFQPAIVPVTTIDGRYLYFDRKIHPENAGGVNDEDDIWLARRISSGWSLPVNLTKVNSEKSDILFSITPDGKALVYNSGLERVSQPFNIINLYADNDNPEKLGIKNYRNDTTNFYAGMSYNTNILLLALKNPSGFGSLDLYVSFKEKNSNNYSEPMNLGSIINTPGIEGSPFLAYDNTTLYFFSTGLGSSRKSELYMARRLDDTWQNWSKPVNIGNIINPGMDKWGFWLNATGDSAYVVTSDTSSRRQGIYITCIPPEFRPLPYTIATGKIYTIRIDKPELLSLQAEISVNIEGDNSVTDTYYSNPETGEYYLVLPSGKDYYLTMTHGLFLPTNFSISTKNINKIEMINRDVVLRLANKPLVLPAKNNTLTLTFDYNSSELTDNAKTLLSDFVKTHNRQDIRITVTGHTDTSGTEEYNLKLSLRRANAVKEFLRSQKIRKQDIRVEGKGETSPVSSNDSENRRVVIEVE